MDVFTKEVRHALEVTQQSDGRVTADWSAKMLKIVKLVSKCMFYLSEMEGWI